MDVSKSECNIVNETSSQSYSSDVLTNVITELNYNDNIKPSASVKEASYFNIFECGRNLLDQLDVTYQHTFTASKTSSEVPPGHYKISPAREIYYDMQAKLLAEKNVIIEKDKIRKAICQVKREDEAYDERNIEILTQEDDVYKSPWKGDAAGLNAVTNSSDLGEITFKANQRHSNFESTNQRISPLQKNSSVRKWTHRHKTSRNRTRFHWARRTSGYLWGNPYPKHHSRRGKHISW